MRVLTMIFLSAALCFSGLVTPADGFFHNKKDQLSIPDEYLKKLGIERPKKKILAPDFALEDLAGQRIRLKDLRGKVIFINFWATWCPPCIQEMPTMEKLHREFEKKGLMILAVNFREIPAQVTEFFKTHKLTFTTLLDHEGKVFKLYGAWALPMSAIVNKRGELVGKVMGYRNWHSAEAKEFFRRLLEEIQ